MQSLLYKFRRSSDLFFCRHFDVKRGAAARQDTVSLRVPVDRINRDADLVAQRIAKRLFRVGGSADLHEITSRFGIKKDKLLEHRNGKTFHISGGRLYLSGGAGAVAAAAASADAVVNHRGRESRDTNLFTTQGAPLNKAYAKRLKLRLEGLLSSCGDGRLPVPQVYAALNLRGSPAIRRWFKRVGLRIMSNGDLMLSDERLHHFRLRRALSVAALLADSGGEAPMDMVLRHVHKPPELTALEDVPEPSRCLPADSASQSWPQDPTSLPFTTETAETEKSQTQLAVFTPPEWIEEWVRQFFAVKGEGAIVTFPVDPPTPPPRQANAPEPMSLDEEEAMLMNIEEELFLRYDRAHETTLAGCFRGTRKTWLKRFYDITPYGVVLPKNLTRQITEAIAIARRMTWYKYTTTDAFEDFGAQRKWLAMHFLIGEDNVLDFDMNPERKWKPPLKDKPPSPYSYAKLDAPRGYNRKGDGKYGKPKYKHGAGGILY